MLKTWVQAVAVAAGAVWILGSTARQLPDLALRFLEAHAGDVRIVLRQIGHRLEAFLRRISTRHCSCGAFIGTPAHAARLGKRFGNWSASPCVARCFRGLVHGDAVAAGSGVGLALELPDHMQARVRPIEAIPLLPRCLFVDGPYLARWTFTGLAGLHVVAARALPLRSGS